MGVSFHLQDPSDPGRTLLDLLAEAAKDAEEGGGVFAFASARGIAMLLDDRALGVLVTDRRFDLVVGTDAVTDERALASLADRAERHPALNPRAAIRQLPGLFHPKFSWFSRGDELRLVVGSGNLTGGGLMSNTEAFVTATLAGEEAATAREEIDDWFARWDAWLVAPTDSRAQARAVENNGSERTFKRPDPEPGPAGEPPSILDDVLVAEVPRNAPGRNQIDIGQRHFVAFFGGQPDREKRIVLRPVGPDGSVGEAERPRSLFKTQSTNYRFEAGIARDRAYPDSGRPIGVFARNADGGFNYMLLWPGDAGHSELNAYLDRTEGESGRAMRRRASSLDQIQAEWPYCPLWRSQTH